MYTIRNQAEQLRPRERLQALGADKLSNHELLAILLRTGTKEMPVLDVSTQIINQMTSLADFKHLSLQELQQIKGIGKVKSIELKAMIELARRIQDSEYKRADQILSSQQLARRMMLELSDSKQEHLIALYLDTQNRIIEQKTIFIGTVRRSVAEPREILYYACKNMATSLIIVHNHPSGSATPSQNDKKFTEKIQAACQMIGIVCLDHIIVGQKEYYSFREEGEVLCD
ncbi:DNA repair protein RadC [Streptococcus hyointestinalis]|uniref:RadC family protein n=1 Tax=Streptococcus hyointestinalis TaxID=1337 RepID=UPI0035130CD7